jgi:DNA-binding NarL/FixJ family response regulator
MQPSSNESEFITVVLAEDHHVVRQGLKALLEGEPDLRVIAEAADGIEAAELAERMKPSVLLLDLMLPSLSGIDVARRVTKRSPQTKVVVLSMQMNEEHVVAALRSGASGYVTKKSSGAEVLRAIREVLAGRRYLSAPFASLAAAASLPGSAGQFSGADPYETLTNREREVLHLAAEGHSNAEIGTRLKISPRTVETHRAKATHKLGLRGQTDLVHYAMQRGLIAEGRERPR